SRRRKPAGAVQHPGQASAIQPWPAREKVLWRDGDRGGRRRGRFDYPPPGRTADPILVAGIGLAGTPAGRGLPHGEHLAVLQLQRFQSTATLSFPGAFVSSSHAGTERLLLPSVDLL